MPPRKTDANRASEVAQLKQLRSEQLNQIREIIIGLEPRLEQARGIKKNQLPLLDSVSLGLYDEVDKLSKKAPAEPVTDLVLNQMNEIIRETKEMLVDDPYIQRLQEFVPAGDNPQHRDAVVVLRQIRQGLDRLRQKIDPLVNHLTLRLAEARAIQVALQLFIEGNTRVSPDEIEDHGVYVPEGWILGYLDDKQFNFNKVDKINIASYFSETI